MFAYRHLTDVNHLSMYSTPYPSASVEDLPSNRQSLPFVQVTPSDAVLPQDKLEELNNLVNPLAPSEEKGKDLYRQTVQFVGNFLFDLEAHA